MSSSFQHCPTQCCCRFVVFISLSTLNVNFSFWCRGQICKRYTQQQLVLQSLLVSFLLREIKIIFWNLSCQFVLVGCIVRRNYLTVAMYVARKTHFLNFCRYLQRYFCNTLQPQTHRHRHRHRQTSWKTRQQKNQKQSRVVAVDSCFTLLGTLQCGTTSREALL